MSKTLTFPATDAAVRNDLSTHAKAWNRERVMRATLGDERYDADSATVSETEYLRMRFMLTTIDAGMGHLIPKNVA